MSKSVMAKREEEIPLMAAALRARVGYLTMRHAALRGLVRSRQDKKGRWWISVDDSLDRYIAERAGRTPEAQSKKGENVTQRGGSLLGAAIEVERDQVKIDRVIGHAGVALTFEDLLARIAEMPLEKQLELVRHLAAENPDVVQEIRARKSKGT